MYARLRRRYVTFSKSEPKWDFATLGARLRIHMCGLQSWIQNRRNPAFEEGVSVLVWDRRLRSKRVKHRPRSLATLCGLCRVRCSSIRPWRRSTRAFALHRARSADTLGISTVSSTESLVLPSSTSPHAHLSFFPIHIRFFVSSASSFFFSGPFPLRNRNEHLASFFSRPFQQSIGNGRLDHNPAGLTGRRLAVSRRLCPDDTILSSHFKTFLVLS